MSSRSKLTQDPQPTVSAPASELHRSSGTPWGRHVPAYMKDDKCWKTPAGLLFTTLPNRSTCLLSSQNLSNFSFNEPFFMEGPWHQGDRALHLQLIFLLCHIHRSTKISCLSIKQPKVVQIFRIQLEWIIQWIILLYLMSSSLIWLSITLQTHSVCCHPSQ